MKFIWMLKIPLEFPWEFLEIRRSLDAIKYFTDFYLDKKVMREESRSWKMLKLGKNKWNLIRKEDTVSLKTIENKS